MQKSIRLLKIWQLCREKRMMTVPRLAPREIVAYIHYSIFSVFYLTGCDVDERTIFRDIQALCEMGVTLASNGGYHVIAEDVLPQPSLSNWWSLCCSTICRCIWVKNSKKSLIACSYLTADELAEAMLAARAAGITNQMMFVNDPASLGQGGNQLCEPDVPLKYVKEASGAYEGNPHSLRCFTERTVTSDGNFLFISTGNLS
jgi:hypothetical protein